MNPIQSTLMGMAAGAGNQYAQQSVSDVAVADGMKQLAGFMQSNNNDAAKAYMQFVQSPQGQQVMRTPGAFTALTDKFRAALTNPPPVATSAEPGSVVTQSGQPYALQGNPGYTPPNPQQINTPAGSTSDIYQNQPGGAKPVGSRSVLPPGSQNMDHVVDQYASGWDRGVLGQIAMSSVASGDTAQQLTALQGLVNAKKMSPEMSQAIANGQMQVIEDKNIPGRFYTIDKFGLQAGQPGSITAHQIGGVMGGSGMGASTSGSSLNSSWTGGPAAQPESFSSSPRPQGWITQPGQQQGAISPQASQMAVKYNVPQESIKSDGTIDVEKAYGAPAQLVLGAGLPAIMQNDMAHMVKWLDPRASAANSDTVRQAEIFADNLNFLSTRLVTGNSRLKGTLESIRELGPEHEKWNDPEYAVDQLSIMRTTLSNIARSNTVESNNMMNEGIRGDNERLSKLRDENTRIQQMLTFLPSDTALASMKQAMVDGKINLPTIGTAAATGANLVGSAASHVSNALFSGGSVDQWNGDIPGTVNKLQNATRTDLKNMGSHYNDLDPAIQRAFDARRQQLLRGGKGGPPNPAKGPAPSNPRNPGGASVTTRSGIADLPPPSGQSNAMYNAQPASPFGGMAAPRKQVNNAFSAIGQ
jgi:hypothetical protein